MNPPTQAVVPVPQLNGEEDATPVAQMVGRVRPVVDPPTQAVATVLN